MVNLIRNRGIIGDTTVTFRLVNEGDKMIAYERKDLVLVFNFHPTRSFPDYPVDVTPGSYRLILNTDAAEFGGNDLVQDTSVYESFSFNDGEHDRSQIRIYIPSRTAFVLERMG
jgi:1,4-alpha-glucan branching enzyme